MLKVSVIVPIYGVEKYIEKCARSIFEQTYTDLEIIFVDDCTPDNSISILKRVLEEYPQMKAKTRILSYEKNKGVAGARQTGLEATCGEYTIQFDPDDYVDRNMIEQMVAKAEEENADIVFCDFNIIQNEKETHVHINPSLNPIDCMKQVLTGEVHGALWNKLIRKSLYTENSIAFIQGLNMREDLSVIYRLLYFARKLAYVPQPFYNYVQRAGSYCNNGLKIGMPISHQQNLFDLNLQIEDFFKFNKIKEQKLLDAFSYHRAASKMFLLLYGDRKMYGDKIFHDIPLKFYITHPTLPWYWNILALMSFFKLTILIRVLRRCVRYLQ